MINVITIDLETIPVQDAAFKAEIAKDIQPPGNMSKAETIAAWEAEKKPLLIEEAALKTSFDGAHGHIAIIGFKINEEPAETIFVPPCDTPYSEQEKTVMREFFNSLETKIGEKAKQLRPRFVGHNIIGFDLRFLYQRCVVLGIMPPWWIPFNARPWDDFVFDTMLAWDARNYTKLDKIAKACGLPSVGEIDGSKVWEYIQAGKIAEVAEYCGKQIDQTYEIYKRMTFNGRK